MIDITFLGTGNAFSQQYYNTNLLLKWATSNLLVDCGTKCPISLHKLAIPISQIQNIFISHLHADHIGGLEEIILQCKYHFRTYPNLYIPENLKEPLWENSLKAGLQNTTSDIVGMDYYFNIHPVQKAFTIDGINFEIIPTRHIIGMPSYGLFFHDIFYTGDTVFQANLILSMLEKARIIIHDCSFIPNPVHAYYKDLLTLPTSVRNRIFLVHYSDNSEKKLEYMAEQGFRYIKPFETLRIS